MSRSKIRIQRDGMLVHLEGKFQIRPRAPAGVAASAEIIVVGLRIICRLARNFTFFLRRQRDAQRLSDAAADVILDIEDVLELPIISFGPDRVAGACLHKLHSNADAVAHSPQASIEQILRVQLLTNFRRSHTLVPVGQHRGPRKQPQPSYFGQFGGDIFGHAVPEVLLLFGAAEIFEIKYSERHLRRLFDFRSCEIGDGNAGRKICPSQPQQVCPHICSMLIANLALFLKHLRDHVFELGRNFRVQPHRRSWCAG